MADYQHVISKLGKNKKYIVICGLVCLAILLTHIMMPEVKDIAIIDGTETIKVTTTLEDVKSLLKKQGISLAEKDKIEPGLDVTLTSGMEIRIKRTREININVDNQTITISTTGDLTGQILKEAGIALGELDKVMPAIEEQCEDAIRVIRVERNEVVEEKKIAFATEKIEDDKLYMGEHRIRQKGVTGLEKYTYDVICEDGQEVERKLLEKEVVRESVKQVVAVGTLQIASRGGAPISFKQVIEMKATGYTHTGNQTSTDIWPTVGIVAVDPKVIPLRTRLYIDGYGYATAMDIGSDIKGNRIDLFFDTKKEALSWGVRTVKVFVLE